MGTGHGKDTMHGIHASMDDSWVKAFLTEPVEIELLLERCFRHPYMTIEGDSGDGVFFLWENK